jgi:integrase
MQNMKVKAKPACPIKNRGDVHRVAEYIRNNYENGEMLRFMFIVGCNTGLRAGDIRKLRPSNFGGPYFDIVEGKTNKTRRVYINRVLSEAAEAYFNIPSAKETKKGNVAKHTLTFNLSKETSNAFIGGQGMPIGVKYMHYVIRDACGGCGLDGNFGSHSMRKTFAYHCYKLCRDLNRVKSILMHSNIELTKKYISDKRSIKRGQNMREKGIGTDLSVEECYGVDLGLTSMGGGI